MSGSDIYKQSENICFLHSVGNFTDHHKQYSLGNAGYIYVYMYVYNSQLKALII